MSGVLWVSGVLVILHLPTQRRTPKEEVGERKGRGVDWWLVGWLVGCFTSTQSAERVCVAREGCPL